MSTVLGDTGGCMAKSRNRSKTRRDASAIAKPQGLLASLHPLKFVRLREVEDFRQFHPGVREPRSRARLARITMRPPSNKSPARIPVGPEVHSFRVPQEAIVCVRRAQRKEVLFAKKRAGRGGLRKPKRNWRSKISCRR